MKISSKFLIGTDPECFIINTKTNKVKSAINIIPGTKDSPYIVEELGPGFALQTDNILAEFNVPPTGNKKAFIENILKMHEYIRTYVKEQNKNYDILCCSSQEVPKGELRSKQAKMFGCDPDYCIYTGKANPKPRGTDTNIRSAGFHLHFGYEKPNIDTSLKLLSYIDAFVGLPSILIDKDTKRRSLYGKAGCFRLTKYGCEYRTLSSYFMKDKDTLSWVWDQVMKGLTAFTIGKILPSGELVQKVINTNDEEAAKSICEQYSICDNFLD